MALFWISGNPPKQCKRVTKEHVGNIRGLREALAHSRPSLLLHAGVIVQAGEEAGEIDPQDGYHYRRKAH